MKQQWQRFWAMSWKVKGPVLGVAVFLLLAAIGAATSSEEEPTAASPDSTLTDAVTQAVAEVSQTSTPKPTEAPKPTNTPAPTATPMSIEAQFAKSYRDNKGFMLQAADDGLEVTWEPTAGLLTFDIHRGDKNGSTGQRLSVGGNSALIANRAIWTTYPAVQQITVQQWEEFTNVNTGQKSESISTRITVTRETAAQFDYDGLKSLQTGDNKRFFCAADEYQIHASVYSDIGDKGCLAQWGPRKN